ncbi:MAG: hypothetical protein H0U21_00780, partial [Acidimicrobiia bacterium]|nr:hypothetical protein [Acidimicrobiia bacterium]
TAPPNPELSLALGRDGLGEAAFGIPAAAALTEMTALLGEPDDDTGWVDPFAISSCAGTVVRRVSWGSLSLLLGDESPFAHGRRHLYGFGYGTVDAAGLGPPGLLTPEGIGLGSAVADLRQAYGEVTVDPGEPGLIDASFYVDDALRGLLTGGEPEDTVTVIFGGQYCA